MFSKMLKNGQSFTHKTNFTFFFFLLVEYKSVQKRLIHFFHDMLMLDQKTEKPGCLFINKVNKKAAFIKK